MSLRLEIYAATLFAVATGSVGAQAREALPPTGDQQGEYLFAPTGQSIPYRLDVPTSFDGEIALPIILFLHGADRSRTSLAGHSMGSGGTWHLAARYPERWRAVAPMSGPFVDAATYPLDLIRDLPILMTEGTGADPSLEGSRALARFMREGDFRFEYLEVDGNHGSMVPMVWPQVFEFFHRGSGMDRGDAR